MLVQIHEVVNMIYDQWTYHGIYMVRRQRYVDRSTFQTIAIAVVDEFGNLFTVNTPLPYGWL